MKYSSQLIMRGDTPQDDEFEEVYEELDNSWRHGCYVHRVFKRLKDDTFWAINGTETGDGEHREYDPPVQVYAHTKTIITTEYRSEP